MTNKYKVWCPSELNGDEAKVFDCWSYIGAVREYAELSYRNKPFDKMTVIVEGENGYRRVVEVEPMPSIDFFISCVEDE